MRAGFAAMEVTPEKGMGAVMGRLSGQLSTPIGVNGVCWPLFVRAAAVADGDQHALIFSLDKNRLLDPAIAEIREAVSEATGIDRKAILIACTHTHNVPFATRWLPGDDAGFAYLDFLKARFATAAATALDHMVAIRWRHGRIRAPGLSRNRRPIYRTSDGEYVGTNGAADVAEFLRYEGPVDDELQVLAAETRDGETIGGLLNFPCHPVTMYSVPVWSADFIGPLTERLQEQSGGIFLFLNGAAGNIAPVRKEIPGADAEAQAKSNARRIGETLAEKALEALKSGPLLGSDGIRVTREILEIPQRRPSARQVELAQWFLQEAKPRSSVNIEDFCRKLYGYPFTMFNTNLRFLTWMCGEIIGMFEWQRRAAGRELYDRVEIFGLALGEAALVSFPAEVFVELGLAVKEQSPFPANMVIEQANGWHGYVPMAECFARGGYETSLGYQSKLLPEAAALMQDAALRVLRSLSDQGQPVVTL